MKFSDIPKFPRANYSIHVDMSELSGVLERWNDSESPDNPLILNPEWQRGHVWTKKQQISYIEYFLQGGTMGRDIYFNCSSWQREYNTPIFCLDGLQRITAALAFVNNEIPAFGVLMKDYEDRPRMIDNRFIFNVLSIKNKRELLKVYVDFNSGGVVHKPKEIERVKLMIEQTPEDETL